MLHYLSSHCNSTTIDHHILCLMSTLLTGPSYITPPFCVYVLHYLSLNLYSVLSFHSFITPSFCTYYYIVCHHTLYLCTFLLSLFSSCMHSLFSVIQNCVHFLHIHYNITPCIYNILSIITLSFCMFLPFFHHIFILCT